MTKTIFANNFLIYFFTYFGISELEVPGTLNSELEVPGTWELGNLFKGIPYLMGISKHSPNARISRKPPRPPRPSTHDPRPSTLDFNFCIGLIIKFGNQY